ncbi:hypothetical protein [Cellulomonas sp. Root137]|uniref:hypothetical protein n=1 Tax=Cellulomonas sp. Root137 TaxID=1736459 RepID=UPI000AF97070|nr:hypothetical protein [Cellulomonas sp. Root137]
MPLWLIITLVGVALVIAGFAGLGTILLWLGLIIVLTGLVTAVLAQRRNQR